MSEAVRSLADLADAPQRRKIRDDLGHTLFVEAAAGTGKTSVLISRVLGLLRGGATTLDRIVAVTFTDKAAGEMKLRLRSDLERARARGEISPEERAHLERAVEQLELARITTIHAFCGDLLRERPVEAGVDPLFEMLPEDEARRLHDRVFDHWLQQVLADPREGVRRVLRRRQRGRDATAAREQLRDAAWTLCGHRDFPAAWRQEPFDRPRELDAVLEDLAAAADLAGRATRSDDWLAQNLQEVARFLRENTLIEAVRGRDHDALETDLRELARSRSWRWRGGGRTYGPGLPREEVLARRDVAKAALDRVLARADADLAACLREELRPVVAEYEAHKKRAGKLDFLDLLMRARDLVKDDPGLRADLQGRFTHLFVDEFQDTDPLQAELLLLLAADDPAETDWRRVSPVPGKLFLVGDPKQSIYRFRRGDVAIYQAVKRQLLARGAQLVHLSTSFRSVPSIQSVVNASFAPAMQANEEGTQADYVPLEAFRGEPENQPSVVALPVPRPYAHYGRITHWQIEESFPDAVGAFVDWLLHASGFTVEDPDRPGQRVPIEPRHVCLLFRRFKHYRDDATRPYARALEVRRIPHVLIGGRSFHHREEVLALRNALHAMEWPDDELRVFATLRGPLFAIADDALLAFRHRVGRLHPLRRLDLVTLGPPDAPERQVADALAILRGLHARRNRRPIGETIAMLLGAVRAHAGLAIWPTGEQALANCLRVLDHARRFERRGAPSFRAFVERLEEESLRVGAEESSLVEEGVPGVRIMTVHKAKGLEFPVVVLADATCRATRETPSRHVAPERGLWAEPLCDCVPWDLLDAAEEERRRDREEAVRTAYVAATRARDLLVVPVLGDEEIEGWVDVINPAVYPPPETRRSGAAATGCPAFGDDSVLERPEACPRGPADAVRPGLHRPRAGAHAVVWWDPRVLDLDRQEEVGLRQQRILEADASGAVEEEGVRKHARWQEERTALLRSGSEPTLLVHPVTTLAAAGVRGTAVTPPGAQAGIAVEHVPVDRSRRPGGVRFGTLVHAVLATVDLHAGQAGVVAGTLAQGRLVGASPEEMEAAARAVEAALEHPLLKRAALRDAAGWLRRESPVLLRFPDGSLAEGVIDLAFRDEAEAGGGWTVVDFKTDREIATAAAAYETQVGLYVQAVAAATGEPARGVLLIV